MINDCGTTKTVAEKKWMTNHLANLLDEQCGDDEQEKRTDLLDLATASDILPDERSGSESN